jgi:arsenate reductase (thioredoxin)
MVKPKVLFLCTGNSCRTQMAEAFLRDLGGDHFEVTSAGDKITALDADAVEAMRELGIDISSQTPKSVDHFLKQRFSFVISLCDRQKERSCPIFPGAIWRSHWDLDNPATAQSPEERRVLVRRVRDQIRRRVVEFVREHQGTRKGASKAHGN